MKALRLSVPTLQFYNELIRIARLPLYVYDNVGGVQVFHFQMVGLPAVPPTPIDLIERAFIQQVCMPLYATIQANWNWQIGATAPPPAPPTEQQVAEMLWQQASSNAP